MACDVHRTGWQMEVGERNMIVRRETARAIEKGQFCVVAIVMFMEIMLCQMRTWFHCKYIPEVCHHQQSARRLCSGQPPGMQRGTMQPLAIE